MSAFKLSSQMLLPVREFKDASFENFYSDRNARAKFLVFQAIDNDSDSSLLLTGPPGSGKTHLLNAALRYADNKYDEHSNVCYFSLLDLSDCEIGEAQVLSLFSSFESYSIMALDHIDSWLNGSSLNRAFKERCIFNLFNHYKMQGGQLLMASDLSIESLGLDLPDLSSRLKSCLLVPLSPYDDKDKEIIMQSIASEKGFTLDDGVANYIIKRSGRSLTELISAVEELDKASLTEHRKLTIPFVKQVLNW